MTDGLIGALIKAYGTGASLTALLLVFVLGPRLVRRLFKTLPRMTLDDWLFAPIHALFALFLGGAALTLGTLLWPGTLVLLLRIRRAQEERRRKGESQEFQSLLDEIRRLKGKPG